jgi:hypothetical protein
MSFERIPNDPPSRDDVQNAGNAQPRSTSLFPVLMLPPSPTKPFASWSSSIALFDAFTQGVKLLNSTH